jgi:hypothetical protein
MSPDLESVVSEAIANLHQRSVVQKNGQDFEVRTLFPVSAWNKGTPCVIGEDSCGNRFLKGSDGTVRFWDHETEEEEALFSNVSDFLAALLAPSPVTLKPGQVKRVWIDPAFLEEQRRKKNA